MIAVHPWREATLSSRLLWPFVRITGGDSAGMRALEHHGIGPAELADPDTRIPHSIVMELLEQSLLRSRDRELGLRAGEQLEDADLGLLAHVVRTCKTLRRGILSGARYCSLVNEAAAASLDELSDVAVWRWWLNDDVPQLPASNDFVVASTLTSWRRMTGVRDLATEVHLMHSNATSVAGYDRVFGCPIKLGMPHNAIVLRREMLDLPLLGASHGLHVAFDLHANAVLQHLRKDDSITARAREAILLELSHGDATMGTVARKLAMSVATLRRRLEEEGTSHRAVLEHVRCELAKRYLGDPSMTITEVAYLLGFSHVTAFYKAFRRWMGNSVTPADLRAQVLLSTRQSRAQS